MGHKISKEQLDPSVKDHIMSFVGNKEDLETSDTSDIINAVNSLIVDRVDNAANMNKLANSIGTPVTGSDNVDEVCNKVDNMTTNFKSKLLGQGVSITAEDKLNTLITKLDELGGENLFGLKYATGSYTGGQIYTGQADAGLVINLGDLGFTPSMVFLGYSGLTTSYSSGDSDYAGIVSNIQVSKCAASGPGYFTFTLIDLTNSSCKVNVQSVYSTGYTISMGSGTFWAFGNEDGSALEDSLKNILTEKGVELSGTESLPELILKVGEISGNVKLTASDDEFIYQNTNYSTFENHDNTYSIVYKMTTTFTGSIRCSIPIRTSNTSYQAYVLFEQLRDDIVIFSKEDNMNSADYTTMTCDINNIQLGDIIQISVKTSNNNTSYYVQTKAPTVSATVSTMDDTNYNLEAKSGTSYTLTIKRTRTNMKYSTYTEILNSNDLLVPGTYTVSYTLGSSYEDSVEGEFNTNPGYGKVELVRNGEVINSFEESSNAAGTATKTVTVDVPGVATGDIIYLYGKSGSSGRYHWIENVYITCSL